MVTDEHGGVAGLVSLEDLTERLKSVLSDLEPHAASTTILVTHAVAGRVLRALHSGQPVICHNESNLISRRGHLGNNLLGFVGILGQFDEEQGLEDFEVSGHSLAHLVLVLDAQNDKTAHLTSP